jgi:hypothetical protein
MVTATGEMSKPGWAFSEDTSANLGDIQQNGLGLTLTNGDPASAAVMASQLDNDHSMEIPSYTSTPVDQIPVVRRVLA